MLQSDGSSTTRLVNGAIRITVTGLRWAGAGTLTPSAKTASRDRSRRAQDQLDGPMCKKRIRRDAQ